MLKYASIDRIAKRVAGRIRVITNNSSNIIGVTGTSIGTDLIDIVGEAVEEFMDMFLTMIYVMPLAQQHFFLASVSERLIIADICNSYFPSQADTGDNTDSFANTMRQQALNDFQCLFNGLGIFVPGADVSQTVALQNVETNTQMSNKAVILPGERIKSYIGYDYDEDNVADTDLYKLNTNVSPTFYLAGNFDEIDTNGEIVNQVRVKDRNSRWNTVEVDFYGF